jgi:hypothetical protein
MMSFWRTHVYRADCGVLENCFFGRLGKRLREKLPTLPVRAEFGGKVHDGTLIALHD